MNKIDVWLKCLVMAVLAALVTGLLSKDDLRSRIITFIAGICAGGIAIIICSILHLNDTVEVISVLISSSFISTIYPILQRWAIRVTNKKLP